MSLFVISPSKAPTMPPRRRRRIRGGVCCVQRDIDRRTRYSLENETERELRANGAEGQGYARILGVWPGDIRIVDSYLECRARRRGGLNNIAAYAKQTRGSVTACRCHVQRVWAETPR